MEEQSSGVTGGEERYERKGSKGKEKVRERKEWEIGRVDMLVDRCDQYKIANERQCSFHTRD